MSEMKKRRRVQTTVRMHPDCFAALVYMARKQTVSNTVMLENCVKELAKQRGLYTDEEGFKVPDSSQSSMADMAESDE